MKTLLFMICLTITSVIYASDFTGHYQCSGGYKKFISGTKKIEQGLVFMTGHIVNTRTKYRPELVEECKATFEERVYCDSVTNFYHLGIDEFPKDCYETGEYGYSDSEAQADHYIDFIRERDWNVLEIFVTQESSEAICTNVVDLHTYTSPKEMAKVIITESYLTSIGGSKEWSITSDKCIVVDGSMK